MPDDEAFDYLATQAVADFLATEAGTPLDGILFPSVQAAGNALNVVLFHKAARVETLSIPQGTEISARTGWMGEDGWEVEYSVIEEVPPSKTKSPDDQVKNRDWPSDLGTLNVGPWNPADYAREASLRIVLDSVEVHVVQRVHFETKDHSVRRHRWEKGKPDF